MCSATSYGKQIQWVLNIIVLSSCLAISNLNRSTPCSYNDVRFKFHRLDWCSSFLFTVWCKYLQHEFADLPVTSVICTASAAGVNNRMIAVKLRRQQSLAVWLSEFITYTTCNPSSLVYNKVVVVIVTIRSYQHESTIIENHTGKINKMVKVFADSNMTLMTLPGAQTVTDMKLK